MRVYGISKDGRERTEYFMNEAQIIERVREWGPEDWGVVMVLEMTEKKFETLREHCHA